MAHRASTASASPTELTSPTHTEFPYLVPHPNPYHPSEARSGPLLHQPLLTSPASEGSTLYTLAPLWLILSLVKQIAPTPNKDSIACNGCQESLLLDILELTTIPLLVDI